MPDSGMLLPDPVYGEFVREIMQEAEGDPDKLVARVSEVYGESRDWLSLPDTGLILDKMLIETLRRCTIIRKPGFRALIFQPGEDGIYVLGKVVKSTMDILDHEVVQQEQVLMLVGYLLLHKIRSIGLN